MTEVREERKPFSRLHVFEKINSMCVTLTRDHVTNNADDFTTVFVGRPTVKHSQTLSQNHIESTSSNEIAV